MVIYHAAKYANAITLPHLPPFPSNLHFAFFKKRRRGPTAARGDGFQFSLLHIYRWCTEPDLQKGKNCATLFFLFLCPPTYNQEWFLPSSPLWTNYRFKLYKSSLPFPSKRASSIVITSPFLSFFFFRLLLLAQLKPRWERRRETVGGSGGKEKEKGKGGSGFGLPFLRFYKTFKVSLNFKAFTHK